MDNEIIYLTTNSLVSPMSNAKAPGEFDLPADNWYMIAPRGEFRHLSTGFIQVIDEKAVNAIVANFKDKPHDILVDFDHKSISKDNDTAAAGWIHDLQSRPDGLWAQIRLTNAGLSAIRGGMYRFPSPVWQLNDCEKLTGNKVRPLKLLNVGLTNNYNLTGLPPMSNRATSGDAAPADSKPPNKETHMEKVSQALGLSADANEAALVSAVTVLINRATEAESREKIAKERIVSLETDNLKLLNSQVESDLVRFENRIKPEAKENFKKQLLANRDATLAVLEMMPNPVSDTIHNRNKSQDPIANSKGDTTKPEEPKSAADIWREKASKL